MGYRLLNNGRIQNLDDGTTFPFDDRLELFKQYSDWLARGGSPQIEWAEPDDIIANEDGNADDLAMVEFVEQADGTSRAVLLEMPRAGIITRINAMGMIEAFKNWWHERKADRKLAERHRLEVEQ